MSQDQMNQELFRLCKDVLLFLDPPPLDSQGQNSVKRTGMLGKGLGSLIPNLAGSSKKDDLVERLKKIISRTEKA